MTFRFESATGRIEGWVDGQALAVLQAVPGFLASVESAADDPAHDRLYPTAYADDADDHEFRRLAHSEIQKAREADRGLLAEVLKRLEAGRCALTTEETEAFARSVGAARLAIAARHNMFDADDLSNLPDSPHQAIVAYLGAVQDQLVQALMDTPAMQP
jgi:hypothetical protein